MSNDNNRNAEYEITKGAEAGKMDMEIAAAVSAYNQDPTPATKQTIETLIARIEKQPQATAWQPTADEIAAIQPHEQALRLRELLRQPRQLDATNEHAQNPPPVSFLVKGWMPDATLTVLTGAGGAGKSRIALKLAVAVATGAESFIPPSKKRPPLANHAPKLTIQTPAPAVFAAWETRRAAFAHRLIAACSPGSVDTCADRLHYVNMRPAGGLWGAAPGKHTSTAGELLPAGELLLDYAAQAQARLLIIDPIAAAFVANENDRALVRAFLSTLDQWADDHNCAVLIIQHPPKSDSAQSGSTDWRNGVQAVWELQPGKNNDWTKPRTLKVDKLNEGSIPDSVKVDYEAGRFVEVNDAGGQNSKRDEEERRRLGV